MRRILKYLLRKPILWLSERFSSNPDRDRIYAALSKLYQDILENNGKKGIVISPTKDNNKFIIFSDQHKGARNGADDFAICETNYLAAIKHYDENGFCYINLGDCEELWENTLAQVKRHNKKTFEAEKSFVKKDAFVKIFGNHDLYWANDPLAWLELERIYNQSIKIYEGVIIALETNGTLLNIFCTHGHQGDASSDGNWFSKFFVARIWAPLQAYLQINPNEPSTDAYKKTIHNEMMYQWSASQKNTLLITGHTHQPVFQSLTHLERLYLKKQLAEKDNNKDVIANINSEVKAYQKRFDTLNADYSTIVPAYFNTGCCCFSDGDITGIEIEGDFIRLIKWQNKSGSPLRELLEETKLSALLK